MSEHHDNPPALAVRWTDAGVPSFPIALGWDEDHVAKRPLTQRGFRDASTKPQVVRRMFRDAESKPAAGEVLGVGLWPGPANILVLDVDVKNGATGDRALADLEAQYGELPKTVRVTTASGGTHIWLAKAKGVHVGNTTLARGIDVRSDDGFVVAPGTESPWGSWLFDGPSALDIPRAHVRAVRWVLDVLADRSNSNGECDAEPRPRSTSTDYQRSYATCSTNSPWLGNAPTGSTTSSALGSSTESTTR
jgi:hypothetical protein